MTIDNRPSRLPNAVNKTKFTGIYQWHKVKTNLRQVHDRVWCIHLPNGRLMRWLPAADCYQYGHAGIEKRPDGRVAVIDLSYTTARTFGDPHVLPTLLDALAWADYLNGMVRASLFGGPDPERPLVEPE